MRKSFAVFFAVLLLATLLAGCAGAAASTAPASTAPASAGAPAASTPPAASTTPLRVGTMPSAVGAPVQYALEKGLFEQEGLNVEVIIFPSGAPINEAIVAGELDVAMSGAATIFSLASGDCKLLADIAESGGMGIWARPDSDVLSVTGEASDAKGMFGSADTLRGKTFFAALGTSSQFNVLRYIQQFGLAETDIELVHMDSAPAAQAFLTGEGDLIASMPPYSTQLEADGAVKVCTFEEATGTALYDMMFAPNTAIETRRDDLVRFMRAVQKAMDEMSDDEARLAFTLPWFKSEGKEYTEESLAQEIADRQYCNSAVVAGADYVFGAAMIGYAEYNLAIEKLEPEQVDNVRGCFDPTILEEALGVDVATPA